MLIVREIKLGLDAKESAIRDCTAAMLGIAPIQIQQLQVVKKSLDARKKSDIHYSCTVQVCVQDEAAILKKGIRTIAQAKPAQPIEVPQGSKPLHSRPFVIGAGPSGLFAAYLLAKQGYHPIIVERGSALAKRDLDMQSLQKNGVLDENSNVAFGEGGAGAYSDGKLTARSKDERGQWVLDTLVALGAPPETAYLAKPHIGTDKLKVVLTTMRERITALGGEYWFDTCLQDIEIADGQLKRIVLSGAHEGKYDTNACILAIGHSARDTYEMLLRAQCQLAPKPFAVGLRIEHEQFRINKTQYGAGQDKKLGPAEYALTAQTKDGRGVFTFCMCPGGEVICASTEAGGIVTNGMSNHARSGKNANSAVIVQVTPQDFGDRPLDGMLFQRKMEQAAFAAGGGGFAAPVQKVGDFLKNQPTQKLGSLAATYLPAATPGNLHGVLPSFVANGIAQGIAQFAKRLQGFDDPYALLTGVETRSSAPVRILRNEDMQAIATKGLFPAGEGAGYAGGIVSAAIDGIKSAQALIGIFKPIA